MKIDVTFVSTPRNDRALSTEKPRTRNRPFRAAYLGTDYWFSGEDVETHLMQIGVLNPGVAQLLKKHGATSAAFITAWNPASEPIGALHNVVANHALFNDLKSGPYACSGPIYSGIGCGRELNWPPEVSLMAVGISLEDATALGQRYGQNAFVWFDASGMPSLVELVDLDANNPQSEERLTWVSFSTLWQGKALEIFLGMHHWRKLNRGEVTSYTTTDEVTWRFLLQTHEIEVQLNQGGNAETIRKGPLEAFAFKVGRGF